MRAVVFPLFLWALQAVHVLPLRMGEEMKAGQGNSPDNGNTPDLSTLLVRNRLNQGAVLVLRRTSQQPWMTEEDEEILIEDQQSAEARVSEGEVLVLITTLEVMSSPQLDQGAGTEEGDIHNMELRAQYQHRGKLNTTLTIHVEDLPPDPIRLVLRALPSASADEARNLAHRALTDPGRSIFTSTLEDLPAAQAKLLRAGNIGHGDATALNTLLGLSLWQKIRRSPSTPLEVREGGEPLGLSRGQQRQGWRKLENAAHQGSHLGLLSLGYMLHQGVGFASAEGPECQGAAELFLSIIENAAMPAAFDTMRSEDNPTDVLDDWSYKHAARLSDRWLRDSAQNSLSATGLSDAEMAFHVSETEHAMGADPHHIPNCFPMSGIPDPPPESADLCAAGVAMEPVPETGTGAGVGAGSSRSEARTGAWESAGRQGAANGSGLFDSVMKAFGSGGATGGLPDVSVDEAESALVVGQAYELVRT